MCTQCPGAYSAIIDLCTQMKHTVALTNVTCTQSKLHVPCKRIPRIGKHNQPKQVTLSSHSTGVAPKLFPHGDLISRLTGSFPIQSCYKLSFSLACDPTHECYHPTGHDGSWLGTPALGEGGFGGKDPGFNPDSQPTTELTIYMYMKVERPGYMACPDTLLCLKQATTRCKFSKRFGLLFSTHMF